MMTDAAQAARTRLLEALLANSRYRDALHPMRDQVVRVACENQQVAALLDRLNADPSFSVSSAQRRGHHRKAVALIEDVFEWMFFASDDFVERARRG